MGLTVRMKEHLRWFLEDDLGKGDVTSALLPLQKATASIQIKQDCVLAGLEELAYLFSLKQCKVKFLAKDGQAVLKGKIVAHITGINRNILGVERTALNVLSRMSGVATACAQARKIAGKSKVQLALTRKTLPGFNLFDKKAAVLAGVWPHRINLSSAILLKDNHLKFFPNVLEAVLQAKRKNKQKKVEVEVETLEEAADAVLGGADIVMLDNFSPEKARNAVVLIRKLSAQTRIELSGGINLNNLKKYSKLGADILSMGSLTHSLKGIDCSLEIE